MRLDVETVACFFLNLDEIELHGNNHACSPEQEHQDMKTREKHASMDKI